MSNTVVGGTKTGNQAAQLATAFQGATLSIYTIIWYERDGTAKNLTGLTLSGNYKDDDGNIYSIDGTLTITDAANGTFTWDPASTDVGTAGAFFVQFEATDGSEYDATEPVAWFVEERYSATAVAGSALVGVTSAEAAWLAAAEGTGNQLSDYLLSANLNTNLRTNSGPLVLNRSKLNTAAYLDGTLYRDGRDPMTADLSLGGNAIVNYGENPTAASIDSGSVSFDARSNNVFTVTLDENITSAPDITWPADALACSIEVVYTQDGTGGRTVSHSGMYGADSGTAPDISTDANAKSRVIYSTEDGGTAVTADLRGKNYAVIS